MSTDTFSAEPVYALRKDDGLQGLTGKQYRFATMIFQGLSDSEAYRRVYDTSGMNDATIGREAHNLAHSPKVTAKLSELRRESDKLTTLAPQLSRQWILERIMLIAEAGDRDSVKLAALVALGKTVGIDLFRETHVTETRQRTIEEIDAELRARLKDLQPVIEGSSRPTPAADVPGDRRRKPKAG